MDGLSRAIEIAGSQQALAGRINHFFAPKEQIGQSAISEWIRRGRIPAEKCLMVAKATCYAVTPHQLRPDLYPNPTDGLPPDFDVTSEAFLSTLPRAEERAP